MSTRRLKDTHPVMQKLHKIFALMEAEGITLQIGSYGDIQVHAKDPKGVPFDLKETEGGTIDELPPMFEYKVTYEVED